MKIHFTDEMKRLLKVCKVPSGLVVNSTINWEDYIKSYTEEGSEGKPICSFSIKDQKEVVKSLSSIEGSKPKVVVLHATEEITQLRKFMVPWFYNYIEFCKRDAHVSCGTMPVWHYVDTSFNDNLLDMIKEGVWFENYKPLLVVDGVYTDSSNNKVEKLRDIISLTLDHTVIILLGGARPFSFCQDRLNFKPKNFTTFNSFRSKVIL